MDARRHRRWLIGGKAAVLAVSCVFGLAGTALPASAHEALAATGAVMQTGNAPASAAAFTTSGRVDIITGARVGESAALAHQVPPMLMVLGVVLLTLGVMLALVMFTPRQRCKPRAARLAATGLGYRQMYLQMHVDQLRMPHVRS